MEDVNNEFPVTFCLENVSNLNLFLLAMGDNVTSKAELAAVYCNGFRFCGADIGACTLGTVEYSRTSTCVDPYLHLLYW